MMFFTCMYSWIFHIFFSIFFHVNIHKFSKFCSHEITSCLYHKLRKQYNYARISDFGWLIQQNGTTLFSTGISIALRLYPRPRMPCITSCVVQQTEPHFHWGRCLYEVLNRLCLLKYRYHIVTVEYLYYMYTHFTYFFLQMTWIFLTNSILYISPST